MHSDIKETLFACFGLLLVIGYCFIRRQVFWLDMEGCIDGHSGGCGNIALVLGPIKETSGVLLGKSVDATLINAVVEAVKKENDVIIKDLHIWNIASGHQAAILSIRAESPLEIEHYQQILKQCVSRLSHVTIEVNNDVNKTD